MDDDDFDGTHCPKCGSSELDDAESHPSGWAGRTTIYITCECGWEKEVGRGSVI